MDTKAPVINPIEIDSETVFVPAIVCEEIERDIVERRQTRGRVRWYKRKLGYGFIREDGCATEIFVHQSSLQFPGVKNLRDGQRVIFDLCTTSKGKTIALDVIPIMEKPEALARYRLKKLDSV